MKAKQVNFHRLFYPIAAVVTVIFCLVYYFVPSLRKSLVLEDQFLENLGAEIYLLSFVLGLIMLARIQQKKLRPIYLIIPFTGLIAFLDDIGFGQRMFNLQMPKVYNVEVDAVHDFATIGYYIIRDHGSPVLDAGLVLAAGLVVWYLLHKFPGLISRSLHLLKRHPSFQLLFVALAIVGASLVADLRPTGRQYWDFVQQLLELDSGIALNLAALAMLNIVPEPAAMHIRKTPLYEPKMAEAALGTHLRTKDSSKEVEKRLEEISHA